MDSNSDTAESYDIDPTTPLFPGYIAHSPSLGSDDITVCTKQSIGDRGSHANRRDKEGKAPECGNHMTTHSVVPVDNCKEMASNVRGSILETTCSTAATVPTSTAVGLGFHEILRALAEAHDVEVRALQSTVSCLKGEAGIMESQGSEHSPRSATDTLKLDLVAPLSSGGTLNLDPDHTSSNERQDTMRSNLSIKSQLTRTFTKGLAFSLRQHWQGKMSTIERSLSSRNFSYARALNRSITVEDLVVSGTSCFSSWMFHPSSMKRLAWDVVCIALLTYDIISIPFVSAFDPEETTFLLVMTWSTMIFWSLDVFASLFTGYQSGKRTILDPPQVWRRYLKSWFALDACLIGLDYVYVITSDSLNGSSAARLGRSLRTLRFIRTLRLVRLLKMKRIIQEIQDHISTETVAISFGIVKIIFCLIIANHLVACGFYGISRDASNGWVDAYGMPDRSLSYRYTTALHWSLTQFTPASMEVFPKTVGERVYSVVVLIFAMVCFSSFVSVLTASMTQLRKIQNDSSRQFWLLRRYMRDWGVSKRTRMRITRYLEYAYKQQKQRVQENEVSLLALLSDPLREEIKYETFAVHLAVHPLFSSCDQNTRVFSKAVSTASLAKGDAAFSCGVEAKNMIFLCNGLMQYIPGEIEDELNNSHNSFVSTPEMVLVGQWVCEPVLWTPWIHLGDLEAMQDSQVIQIDSSKFGETVASARKLLLAMRRYAEGFLAHLNEVDKEDLSDLCHTLFSSQEILDDSGFTIQSTRSHFEEEEESMVATFRKTVSNFLFKNSGQE